MEVVVKGTRVVDSEKKREDFYKAKLRTLYLIT
jgi:hypothetical protein